MCHHHIGDCFCTPTLAQVVDAEFQEMFRKANFPVWNPAVDKITSPPLTLETLNRAIEFARKFIPRPPPFEEKAKNLLLPDI